MHALDALGSPIRRDILLALRDRPLAVGELAERFPVSRPAISKHLRVLEEAGLVEGRADSATVYGDDPEPTTPTSTPSEEPTTGGPTEGDCTASITAVSTWNGGWQGNVSITADQGDATVPAQVAVAELAGAEKYIYLDVAGMQIIARTDADSPVRGGDRVGLHFRPDRLHLFDGTSDEAKAIRAG